MLPLLRSFILLAVLCAGARAAAIVSSSGDTYQTTVPNVANWNTGWSGSGLTGWDYVGQVNEASGVYLGNGFVLTCGHVGAGALRLDGVTYDLLPGSAQSFGSADLTLFQIATTPDLPALTLRSGNTITGSNVVAIGFGIRDGSRQRTWVSASVSGSNETVNLGGYTTTDFYSLYNATANPGQLIGGDSGGADFRYNTVSQKWELAGLNEATGSNSSGYQASYFVQLSAYKSSINAAMLAAAPEPGTALLLALSLAGLGLWRRRR